MSAPFWETISIGSDESGKGDFFGAPTVVAVQLDKKALEELKEQPFYEEIKDSKEMNKVRIEQIAPVIMRICKYKRITLSPAQYNDLYAKYQNVNALFAVLHNKVHMDLNSPHKRIIDAFASEDNYYKYLSEHKVDIQKIDYFYTKADSQYLSVALASIIARYYYVKQIEELSEKTGVVIPLGNRYEEPNSIVLAYKLLMLSGYSEEQIARDFVKSHFSSLKKIKALL